MHRLILLPLSAAPISGTATETSSNLPNEYPCSGPTAYLPTLKIWTETTSFGWTKFWVFGLDHVHFTLFDLDQTEKCKGLEVQSCGASCENALRLFYGRKVVTSWWQSWWAHGLPPWWGRAESSSYLKERIVRNELGLLSLQRMTVYHPGSLSSSLPSELGWWWWWGDPLHWGNRS